MSKDLFNKALELQRQGALTQAEHLYKLLLQEDEQQSHVLHQLSLIYVAWENWTLARDYLLRAIAIDSENSLFHFHLGHVFKKLGQFDQALIHYKYAEGLCPNQVDIDYNIAVLYYEQHDFGNAEYFWEKSLVIEPDFAPSLYFLGQLKFQRADFIAAKAMLERVVKAHDHPGAQKLLGNIALLQEEPDKAIKYYQQALLSYPEDIEILNNLGVSLVKLHRDEEAIYYFIDAIAIDKHHPEALNNLAALYLRHDRFEVAERHYQELVAIQPESIEAHYNLGVCLMSQGELLSAMQEFETTLNLEPNHFDALCNIAAIYLKQNNREKSLEFYQKARDLRPTDASVNYQINALLNKQVEEKSPLSYVKNLFDNYAGYYEKHLLETLNYQVPKLILEMFLQIRTDSNNILNSLDILDLGCGSGLIGNNFKPYANYLAGVDVSPRMLIYAKEKEIYDELCEQDILSFMQNTQKKFDIILAGDVFVYFGDLSSLFFNIKKILKPKGLFIFSVESSATNKTSFLLQETCRFCHSQNYIESLAQKVGLQVVKLDKITPRLHENKPVSGLLVALQQL